MLSNNITNIYIFFPEYILFIITIFYFTLFFFPTFIRSYLLNIFHYIYLFLKKKNIINIKEDIFFDRLYVLIGCLSFLVILYYIIDIYFLLDNFKDGGIHVWYLSVTMFSMIFKFFIILFAFLIFIILFFCVDDNYFKDVIDFKFFCILFFLILNGILWSICVDHLLLLFLCLEIQSLGYYIISGMKRESFKATNSSLHFFYLSVFISCLFLISLLALYISTGSLYINDILVFAQSNSNLEPGQPVLDYVKVRHSLSTIFICGSWFCLSSVFFKLAAIPFHFWVANLYTNTHLISFLLFYILPKFAYFFICFKLICVFHPVFFTRLGHHFYFFSFFLTFFTGFFYAFYETNFRKLLAYSAVMNLGIFMLAAVSFNTVQGIAACLIYFICYAFTSYSILLIFYIMTTIEKGHHLSNFSLYDFARIVYLNPLLGVLLTINFLSFAGIPPLGGFFVKFFLINKIAAISEMGHIYVFYVLALTVCAASIYVRAVNILYSEVKFYGFNNILKDWVYTKSINWVFLFLLIFCLIIIFLFAFYFTFLESHIITCVKKFLSFLFGRGF